jgi:molybdopterin/thiamine biosynthesis adenylyltransferase
VQLGCLVSELSLAGDITTTPSTHVVMFVGSDPCDNEGRVLEQLIAARQRQPVGDLIVDITFSRKPTSGAYDDYYHKMTTYVTMLGEPGELIDPHVTAKTFPVVEPEEDESPFRYIDTASARGGIEVINAHLNLNRVAIIGLGGTGSYVLDLVAKTPVKEIHLFDGDRFLQHNAFRAPGAPSVEVLRDVPQKVAYFASLYSTMHRNIVPHDFYIDASHVEALREMEFVFLCLDRGTAKRLLVERLVEWGVPFVEVGMGLFESEGALGGLLRLTSSTPRQQAHVGDRIPFSDGDANNQYAQNIQIADLNALSAALAVIKWKKVFGFYVDLEHEHHSVYQIDGNVITNEECA